jgi:hypothetical protein
MLSKIQVRDLWYNLVWELDCINDKTRDDYFDIKDFKKILDKSDIEYEK